MGHQERAVESARMVLRELIEALRAEAVECDGTPPLEQVLPVVTLALVSLDLIVAGLHLDPGSADAGRSFANEQAEQACAAARALRLTPAQTRVLVLLVAGRSPDDIATVMGSSGQAVDIHVKRIVRATRATSWAEVAARLPGLAGAVAPVPALNRCES